MLYTNTFANEKSYEVVANDDGTTSYVFLLQNDEYDEFLNVNYNKLGNKYIISNNDEAMAIENKNATENYLKSLDGFISNEEIEFLMEYIPEFSKKIYFDADYNDVSFDDMNKIYELLIKIFNIVKVTAKPEIDYEYPGIKYLSGFNIDFIRANIKSLHNILYDDTKIKVPNINDLSVTYNNERIFDTRYDGYGNVDQYKFKIEEISELIDDSYYNVCISQVKYIQIGDIEDKLKVNDKIVIINNQFNDDYYNYVETYVCKSEILDPKHHVENYDGRYIIFESINEMQEKDIGLHLGELKRYETRYIIKVLKNAIVYKGNMINLISDYVKSEKMNDEFVKNLNVDHQIFDTSQKDKYYNKLDINLNGYVKALFYDINLPYYY